MNVQIIKLLREIYSFFPFPFISQYSLNLFYKEIVFWGTFKIQISSGSYIFLYLSPIKKVTKISMFLDKSASKTKLNNAFLKYNSWNKIIWDIWDDFSTRNYSKGVDFRLFYTISSLANWYSFFCLTIMQIIEKKIATRASFKIVMLWLHLSFVIARNWQVWSWAHCKGKCRDTMGLNIFWKNIFMFLYLLLIDINLISKRMA